MKAYKKTAAGLAVLIMALSAAGNVNADAETVNITVYPDRSFSDISPYIYGVNSGVDMSAVTAKSFRLGGNRMSAYNWENNMSNAGSDWKHTSDKYLVNNAAPEFKKVPGGAALDAAKTAEDNNIPYALLTLQMLGYAASNMAGTVSEENSAPSDYWVKVENRKEEAFSAEPDKNDDSIYMDEYLAYLAEKIGKSDSGGFRAYALDNEPALWSGTHSRVQLSPITCGELIDKSVELASVVKDADSGADVFGPALYGYMAFTSLQGASDWDEIKEANGYRWFIDYYLDEMKKAEEEQGRRLLDVLDLHFYTEAKGACGERACSHYDDDGCIQARIDSVRSLYDPDYHENSWIADAGAEFFPLLPNINESVEKYYPGTKIAFTEYNFGGGDHISGAVAEAETLGIFAENGVYFSSIWSMDKNEYQLSAINMFTNYDGQGNGFGDTLTESVSSDRNAVSVYSSTDGGDAETVKIIAVNKSIHEETAVNIALNGEKKYGSAQVYGLYGDSTAIREMDGVSAIKENSFSYSLPPLSVTEFVVTEKKFPKSALIAAICAVCAVAAGAVGFIIYNIKKKN